MQHEKKYWEGYCNGDDSDAFVQFTEYINCKDFRFGITSDKGFAKQLESVGGTALIPNLVLPRPTLLNPGAINYTIGVAYDWSRRRVVYWTWNNQSDHFIWCYDFVANKIYAILLNSQVTGGLGFEKNHLIHSARVENGCAYWTENLNEPRRVDIDAGIKLNNPSYVTTTLPYTAPLSQAVIAWIRRQPGLPPTQMKLVQTFPVVDANQVANGAWTFAYRYIYRNYELSTLSGQSTLANYNATGETFNSIDVAIPFGEKIEQDVIQIDLVARFLEGETDFVIHSWNKKIAADAAAIIAHNAGTTQLVYRFYNASIGIALDAAYAFKIADNVPLKAQTLEMAKGRAFMANYTIGYDSPLSTSLAVQTVQKVFPLTPGGPITGEWFLLKFFNVGGPLPVGLHSFYVLQTTVPVGAQPPAPIYIYQFSGSVPPYPASVNASDLTFLGSTTQAAANTINPGATINAVNSYVDQGTTSIVISGATPVSSVVGTAFKSFASYQVSISFKDNYGRETGVVTNQNLLVQTPDTGLSAHTYIIAITWLLNNSNALNEIPISAYYYSINLTKCLRTRFFIQSLGTIIYAAKDASGNYTFTTTAYSADLAGVAIDLTFLGTHGQGYVLSEGDVVRLYVNGAIHAMAIIGQAQQFIVAKLTDVGSLSAVTGIFEIYTPYKQQADEPYFEQAQIFPVSNPGTGSRSYSTLSGSLFGDVYLFARTNSTQNYITEAMNINDNYYKNWFTSAGKPNFVDRIGQVTKPTAYCFSNTFIQGSQNNGLSTFDALDSGDIGSDFGPVQKLQISSKVQKIGSVMLAICSGPTTASMYLGENTLISQTGDAVIAQANTVVGSIHELKGGFGTLNPESVVEFRGNIYWFDVQNGKIIQYAENGLFPISNYKLSRYWKLFSDQYKSMTAAQIEALGSRPFVFGTVDPHHGELLFTVPRTLATPPMGFLPDYPSVPYPFDIWDGQAKTLVFKLYAEPNRWQGSYSFAGDYMFYLEDNLYSFNGGDLYLHNQPMNYCQYYGIQYMPAIMDLCNQQLNKPRVPNNYSAEANNAPTLVYFMTRYPYVQATDLLSSDFSNKEGIFYAAIYRNKLDPAFNNQYDNALLKGEELRATAIYMMGQWDATQGIVQVKFTNISYTVSLGQPV